VQRRRQKKLGSRWGSRATFGLVKRSSFCKGSYFAVDPLREGGCPSRQPVDCHQAFPPRWLLLSELTRPPPLLNKANPLRPARQVRPLRGLFVRRATFARPTSGILHNSMAADKSNLAKFGIFSATEIDATQAHGQMSVGHRRDASSVARRHDNRRTGSLISREETRTNREFPADSAIPARCRA
jgi:hypothetical protein